MTKYRIKTQKDKEGKVRYYTVEFKGYWFDSWITYSTWFTIESAKAQIDLLIECENQTRDKKKYVEYIKYP